MYSVMKKNIENSDAPTRSPTMLAPVNVRDRKIRNGINGASDRIDRHECRDERRRERQQPSVWAEPACVASTSA